MVKVPALSLTYSVNVVNAYCGKRVFPNNDGSFIFCKGKYMFQYTTQIACSNTNSDLHEKFTIDLEAHNPKLYEDNMFGENDSPGKAFFQLPSNIVECNYQGQKCICAPCDNVTIYLESQGLPVESDLELATIKQLQKTELVVENSRQIKSVFGPFSGGGDIAMFGNNSTCVFIMRSSLAPNSPTTSDDEDTLSLDMELKRGLTDEVNGLKQLCADMMVTLARSVEKMEDVQKLRNLKKISVYGLLLDVLLPLRLLKLTMNFKESQESVSIVQKFNGRIAGGQYLLADRLITYMIRNMN